MYDGSAWHCELCDAKNFVQSFNDNNFKRSTLQAAAETGIFQNLYLFKLVLILIFIVETLTDYCKCLSARYEYWRLNPDVYLQDIDPVYHYQVFSY